jgi:transposase
MIDLISTDQVYLASGYTDLRRSIDGLAALVQTKFKLNPFSSSLFVFCNKSRNRIKILKWDGSGFWLLLKRLDKGSFRWPQDSTDIKNSTIKELRWILDGLSMEQPKAFKERYPKTAI